MLQTEYESGFVVSIPLYLSLVPQSSKQQTDRDDFSVTAGFTVTINL